MTEEFSEETHTKTKKISNKKYNAAMADMQVELVKLQEWVKQEGVRVAIIFEGRDAAGKGGTIKRLTQSSKPPCGKDSCPASPHRAREDPMVFPTLSHAFASCRRNRDF